MYLSSMAKTPHTTYTYTDDLTGKVVGEDEYQTVEFTYHGDHYAIDLGAESANKLDAALAPYIEKARKAYGRYHARPKKGSGKPGNLASIRSWAKENGHPVSDRGRIPQSVVDAYREAH